MGVLIGRPCFIYEKLRMDDRGWAVKVFSMCTLVGGPQGLGFWVLGARVWGLGTIDCPRRWARPRQLGGLLYECLAAARLKATYHHWGL